MVKVKCGAVIKDVAEGSLKWYKMAGWKIIEEKKVKKKDENNDKTNSEEITSA